MGKMEDITGEGRTVLFVSHNMAAVQNLCTVAYALDHGRVFASGGVDDVIGKYLESVSRLATIPLASRTDRKGTGRLRLTRFSISGAVNSTDTVQCGAPASFEIAYEGNPPLEGVEIEMLFYDHSGVCVVNANNVFAGRHFEDVPQKGKFVCRFARFPLLPGVYHLNFYSSVRGVTADFIRNAATLQVIEGDYYGSGKLPVKGEGIVAVPHDWEVTG